MGIAVLFEHSNLKDEDYSSGYSPRSYEKKYEGYFQYANVPSPHEYEFGYNRGNPAHYTSRYEQGKDGRFRTKVKWADAYSGYGEHYYEYNHAPYAAAYVAPVAAYSGPAPAYEAPVKAYDSA